MKKIIKKVLMCEPGHFEVNYEINPWMKIGSVDKRKAYKQWMDLLEIYRELKIKVEIIEQKKELPDMVFTADQGIINKNEVLLSNFYFHQRKGESRIFQEWFEKSSYKIRQLPENFSFEGSGDCLWFGKKLLMGFGFRGEAKNANKIKEIWREVKIIPLRLINPYFYHLDTCLFVLNNQTVFYYPKAFSEKSRLTLKEIVPNLIAFDKKEAFGFAANSIVTDHQVICQINNQQLMKEVENLGYKTIAVDVREFNKSGGGIHCLTSVLEENI